MTENKNSIYRMIKEYAEQKGKTRFLIAEVFPRFTNHYHDLQELELLGYVSLEDESCGLGSYMSLLK